MVKPKMWRQRYIPYEIVDLSNDEILYRDNKLLVTKWKVIHPHTDIQNGISYIFLDKGLKISKHYDENGEFVKYYCDIMEIEYKAEEDTYIFKDLLIDVKITPDKQAKLVDFDELAEALEKDLITKEQAIDALKKLDYLLKIIYSDEFPPIEVNKDWRKDNE